VITIGPAPGVSTNAVIEVQSRFLDSTTWSSVKLLTNSTFQIVGMTGGRLFRGRVIGEFARLEWDSALPYPAMLMIRNFGTNIGSIESTNRRVRFYSTSRTNRISAFHFDPTGQHPPSTATPDVVWTNHVGQPARLIIR
jgi:hypothetical protein